MGQAGQLALSIGGAVVGAVAGAYFAGNPVLGAELGFAAGGAIGGLVFQQKGPNPADIRIQDSAYGKPIPVLYGMYRVAGNMIWAGQPYVEDQGKGGKGSNQQKVAMSFAIAICKGPITGVRRIWANGKLIYDVSNPSNFQAISGSSQMVGNFTFYSGDENQQPDPTMQAALGINATPAYRGLAYVVFNNLDLSTWSNYLPSFSFEVLTEPVNSTYANTVSTFALPWGFSIVQMPCLTAQGAVVMAYDEYLYDQNQAVVINLTPYGAQQIGVVNRNAGNYYPAGNSDVPGFLAPSAWYHPDGSFDDLSLSTYLSRVSTFWRNGSDLYVSGSSTAGTSSNAVYRLQIPPASLPGSTTNLGGTVLATSASLTNGFTVIGGTASYVYAMNNATLYRLDRNTLTTVASWSSPGGGTFGPLANVGCAYDDDHIYLQATANGGVYLFRPPLNTLTLIGVGPFAGGSFNCVNPSLFLFGQCGLNGGTVSLGYMTVGQGETSTTLGEIVADICNRAGMSPGQYDVSQLTDLVTGYGITNHSVARSNLMPLMAAYFFDACDTDGLIKFVKRGSQPAGTFAYADLGASATMGDTANTNPITQTITQEVDLPRSLTLTYLELESDYNQNSQRWSRAVTHSNKDTAMQVPIVLSGGDALMRAQAAGWSAWVGRKTFAFSTPLSYLQYEPGGVVTLQGVGGESYTVRLTRCQYDGQGSLIWQAALEDPDIYPSTSFNVQPGTAAGFATQSIGYSGPTMLAVLDVPPLQNTDTSQGLYLAACGFSSSWPGCAVDVSRPGGAFGQVMNLTKPATMGTATSALGTFSGGNQPDELNAVTVTLYSGTLASCTYANFLAGANAAYLGGELVFFRNAVQTAANVYTLSGLLRGRGGTEYAMSAHAGGELFVLLDASRIASLPLQLTDIGSPLSFETYLLNLFGNTPGPVQTTTPSNARVKPLRPHLLRAIKGSASSLLDITVTWIRKARVNTAWLSGADVPLDESAEVYTISIYSGSTLKRQYVLSNAATAATWAGGGPSSAQTYPPFTAPSQPTFVYTAAMATADGFSVGNPITFQVQQNSDQGVLGYAATATITR